MAEDGGNRTVQGVPNLAGYREQLSLLDDVSSIADTLHSSFDSDGPSGHTQSL